jgi:pimeloyl-ACP methyl ester carboxylesterase
VTIIELEAHRRTVTTPQGPVSCIHVGSRLVALFVHGLGTNALLWRHVIRAFAGERRCVAIDLPLHGRPRRRQARTSAWVPWLRWLRESARQPASDQ